MEKTDVNRENPALGRRNALMSEKPKSVTLACRIDRRTFSRFARYDTLVRKKGWRNPALFALIMTAFAAVCFFARKTHAQALLLGGVLLGVGLILPLVWFGMFFASVRRQAKRSGLSPDTVQYTVTLSDEKIHVTKGKEAADFKWEDTHMARRVEGCIYLFVSPTRAFLLPDCEETERAWSIITEKLDPGKVFMKT